MMPTHQTITGIILAGGQGSRMGGIDKGLHTHEGFSLITSTLKRLMPQTSEILISANRNIERYQKLGHTVVQDSDKTSYQGPMAGISECIKVLQKSEHDFALIASCDTPNIPTFLVERLLNKLVDSNAQLSLVHDGVRRQNLHCLIKRNAWQHLINYFEGGGRAMHRWQKLAGDAEIDFSDCADAFKNINHQQLKQLKQQ